MLTDNELIARLRSFEDAFVERKSKSDRGGWLKTIVAFANSTPIGYPATLFIGVDDSGQIVDQMNVESTMRSVSDLVGEHAWPPIYILPKAVSHEGKSCVAVIVPGSSERPHFAGRSYVRVGEQTKDASEQQFAELIAQRSSKARKILDWKDKEIAVVQKQRNGNFYSEQGLSARHVVETCDAHFVTLKVAGEGLLGSDRSITYSMHQVELGFGGKPGRLILYVYADR